MKARYSVLAVGMVALLFVPACGQQTVPPQSEASVTSKKGQIVQPEVKPGKPADGSSLLITLHGCADLVLSDPHSRKLGYDAIVRKSYQQIPGGIYDEGDLLGDDTADDSAAKPAAKPSASNTDCASDKTLQVPQPLPGNYSLSIQNLTGNPFKLGITSYGQDSKQNGHFAVSQLAAAPVSSTYQFRLPPTPGGVLGVKSIQRSMWEPNFVPPAYHVAPTCCASPKSEDAPSMVTLF